MEYQPKEMYNANTVENRGYAFRDKLYQGIKNGLVVASLTAVVLSSSGCITGMKLAKADRKLNYVQGVIENAEEKRDKLSKKEQKRLDQLKDKVERVPYELEKKEWDKKAWDNLTDEQKEQYKQNKQKVVILEDFVDELNQQGR